MKMKIQKLGKIDNLVCKEEIGGGDNRKWENGDNRDYMEIRKIMKYKEK